MSFLKKIIGKAKPSEPIFPGENFSIVKIDMKEGWALATVNKAYDNYPNKSFYPWLVGVELQIVDKNDNGHPTDDEAVRLNAIQEELELFLKRQHVVHFVARVTRNGFRDFMIYIDELKLTQEEVNGFFVEILKTRDINFSVQRDPSRSAVSGFIK